MLKHFSNNRIFIQLNEVCNSSNLQLPCDMDSWHGFESVDALALVNLGRRLESLGWRFVGIWPSLEEANFFHLKVTKSGIYGEDQLIEEIEMMKKLATEFSIENYTECSPQPFKPVD